MILKPLLIILLPLTKASRAVSATLEEILAQALQELAAVNDLNQLDKVRVHYLGKKGLFTLRMKELGLPTRRQLKADRPG